MIDRAKTILKGVVWAYFVLWLMPVAFIFGAYFLITGVDAVNIASIIAGALICLISTYLFFKI